MPHIGDMQGYYAVLFVGLGSNPPSGRTKSALVQSAREK